MRIRASDTLLSCISSATLLIGASAAHADAIDGEWCRGADNFKIEGSAILTTGRAAIQGEYNRYRFAYVVPPGETGAGGDVKMVMIRGREMIHLTRPGTPEGQPEVWMRCKPVS